MSPNAFNVELQYQRIADLLRPIDIESALLFCNHVLTAWRGENSDPVIRNLLIQLQLPSAAFLVHLAARQVLLQSLGPSNRAMGTEDFKLLINLLWEILDHDPAMKDPGWMKSDPTGSFIRYTGLQQRLIDIPLQTYGLAVALFTEEMPRGSDETLDVPARLQEVLRMSPMVFMRAGHVAGSTRLVNSGRVKLPGTISSNFVEKCPTEFGADVVENWSRFLELVSSTQSQFRSKSHDLTSACLDIRYDLYRFNLLRRFPLIDVGRNRYVIVDPNFIKARTTLGMYFDLLEADCKDFTDSFGYRFANLVGDLTRRAYGGDRVWSESNLPQNVRTKPPSKNADHAILGDTATVLVECKAFRPSTKLLMMGDQADTDAIVARVAAAVRQLTEHGQAVRTGKWTPLGLVARECFGVVVTYGWIPTANGSIFRRKVRELLLKDGCAHLPYTLLSINEYDSFLRLVELGKTPDAVIANLSANDNGGFPGSFKSTLTSGAISNATYKRGKAFFVALHV